jgi:hypothetical protein
MMNPYLLFIMGCIVTWRVTELIVFDAGPADFIKRIRLWSKKWEFLYDLLSCGYCSSVYVSAIVTGYACWAGWITGLEIVPYWWGWAGGAMLISRIIRERT